MAKPSSLKICQDRHRDYRDVGPELMESDLQMARLRRMAQMVPAKARVLDIGCNSGYMYELTRPRDYWGVDISEKVIQRAIVNYGPVFRVAPAEDLPFDDGEFDCAILGEILEHVFDPVSVVDEAARVASKCIVGSVPTDTSKWGAHTVLRHAHHVRAFDDGELYALLSPLGLPHIERLQEFFVFRVMMR